MKTGIYCIKNKINGKRYIGSSSFSLYYRLKHHLNSLNRKEHCNEHLQRSWNKYGPEAFQFDILEIVEPNKCLEKEQEYINKLNPEYNICKIARSILGIKRSDKTKKILSDKKIGKLNPMAKRVCVQNNETKQYFEFDTLIEASYYLNINKKSLGLILNGKRKLLKRLHNYSINFKNI